VVAAIPAILPRLPAEVKVGGRWAPHTLLSAARPPGCRGPGEDRMEDGVSPELVRFFDKLSPEERDELAGALRDSDT